MKKKKTNFLKCYISIGDDYMEEDIFKAINILRKYNSEANMIEAKSSTLGFPKKNAMTLFLVFLINMAELLYLD